MVKDAFSDDVPRQFFVNYTTLDSEDSMVTKADKALTPSKVNYKVIVSGKSLMQQVLGSKDYTATSSSSKGDIPEVHKKFIPGHQEGSPEVFLDATFERHDTPMSGVSNEQPLDSLPIQCTWYPGIPNKAKPQSPRHSPDPSVGFMPTGFEEGYKSDHPYFVDTPYVMPSGVEVIDDSVSRPVHSLAVDLLKNYMLITKVIGAMKVQSPTRLHNHFAHYQLRWDETARVAEEFEWEKFSLGEEMRRRRETQPFFREGEDFSEI
ncbi:hypothetical protein LIER_21638 [Lithospermum erythrorhizon]|uniref:Uncharacterized protein n=1 Tax=Lithospermum erythrorhizon TaxID=34254 RepID=A0AAV3QTB8_LITER